VAFLEYEHEHEYEYEYGRRARFTSTTDEHGFPPSFCYLPHMTEAASPGKTLALVVGLGFLAGAGVVALTGGETLIATILVLVGASALAGWARARRQAPKK
jgi:hypothetical protein